MKTDRISGAGQISIYLGKCFRLFVSEKQWINFISTAIIMLLVCMVTSEDMFANLQDTRNGGFAVVCACIWVGLFNSIRSVCRERDIVKREHRTGLRISSYILAHVAYEAVICAGEAVIVTAFVCVKNLSHLPPAGLILSLVPDFFVTFFLVAFASDMLALLISCIVRTENTAMTVMPFVLIIQLVMSGCVFELEGLTEIISYATVSRYGLNAVCAVSGTDWLIKTSIDLAELPGCEPTAANLALIWLILLGFAILYIALGMLALRRVDKDSR